MSIAAGSLPDRHLFQAAQVLVTFFPFTFTVRSIGSPPLESVGAPSPCFSVVLYPHILLLW